MLFIDTQMLFPETLAYQQEVAERLSLTNVQVITASEAEIAAHDPDGTLHKVTRRLLRFPQDGAAGTCAVGL